MSAAKQARTFAVPIVMDPDVESIYLDARHALDARAETLLESAALRIRAAREAAGDDPNDRLIAAGAVVTADEAELAALRTAVTDAETALDAVTTKYRFRSLGRKAWKDLVTKHPATPEDQEAWAAEGHEGRCPWHEDGLARDLIHKAAVSPLLSPEDVAEIFDGADWNASEISLLWTAALYVQSQAPQR